MLVSAIYPAADCNAVCQDERSHFANGKLALLRFMIRYMETELAAKVNGKREMRSQHNFLELGRAVAVFRGPYFRRD